MDSPQLDKDMNISSLIDMAIVHKKYNECLPKLMAFAEDGYIEAVIALMHIYYKGGHGVIKNNETAKLWAEVAYSTSRISYAAHILGLIHYHGINGAPNRKLAYQYFRKAALQGYQGSLLILGSLQSNKYWQKNKQHSGRIILIHCLLNNDFPIWYRILAASNIFIDTGLLIKFVTNKWNGSH